MNKRKQTKQLTNEPKKVKVKDLYQEDEDEEYEEEVINSDKDINSEEEEVINSDKEEVINNDKEEEELMDFSSIKKFIKTRRQVRGIELSEQDKKNGKVEEFDPKSLEEKKPKHGAIYKVMGTCVGFEQQPEKKINIIRMSIENINEIINQAKGQEPSNEKTIEWYKTNRTYLPSIMSIKDCYVDEESIKVPIFNHNPNDKESNNFKPFIIKNNQIIKASCMYTSPKIINIGDKVVLYNLRHKNKRKGEKKVEETTETTTTKNQRMWFLNCDDIKVLEEFDPQTEYGIDEMVDNMINLFKKTSTNPIEPIKTDGSDNNTIILPSSTELLMPNKKTRICIEDIITISSGKEAIYEEIKKIDNKLKFSLRFAMQGFIQYKSIKGWVDFFCDMWNDISKSLGMNPWSIYLIMAKNHIPFMMAIEPNLKNGGSMLNDENNLVRYKNNEEMTNHIMTNPNKTLFNGNYSVCMAVFDIRRTMKREGLRLDRETAIHYLKLHTGCKPKLQKMSLQEIEKKQEFDITSDWHRNNYINSHSLGANKLGIVNLSEFTGDAWDYLGNDKWELYLYVGGLKYGMDHYNEQCRIKPDDYSISPSKESLWKRAVDLKKVKELINKQTNGKNAEYTSVLWAIKK